MTEVHWEGHTIEFIPVLSHKTLWLATINELWIDGKLMAKSGGFSFNSEAKCVIKHHDHDITIEVKSSTSGKTLSGLNYEVIIDGETVDKGIAKARYRW